VTGGAGFIGGNLCRRAGRRARTSTQRLVALDDSLDGSGRPTWTGIDGVELVEGLHPRRGVPRPGAARGLSHRPPRRPGLGAPVARVDPMASHDANATGTLQPTGGRPAPRPTGPRWWWPRPRRCTAPTARAPQAVRTWWPLPVSPYAVEQAGQPSRTPWPMRALVRRCPSLAFRFFNVFGPLQRGRARLRRGRPHLPGRRARR
jgi:hypothetical protein